MGVSLLTMTGGVRADSLENETKPSCAALGYNTNVQDCLDAKGTPLLCPFSGQENPVCLCVSDSCRGYPLQKNGTQYYYINESGRKITVAPISGKVEDYIDGNIESCTVGFGEDKTTYYRVPKCKGDYLFQNYICDEGCDTVNKYPYSYHPGNLPGKVEECVNEASKWYGYVECNEGWTLDNGKCNLNTCSILEYPYVSDPNLMQYRGQTLSCKIGGNTYYKYTTVDKDGVPLTSDTCGLNGYTLSGGVCRAKCEINTSSASCKATVVTTIINNNSYSYNTFNCGLKNAKDCRVGDIAVINGVEVGTIFHLPENSSDKVLVMGGYIGKLQWADGVSQTTDIPDLASITSLTTAINDSNGKLNTAIIKAFATAKNYSYPAAKKCWTYESSGCNHPVCQAGEWYLPSLKELGYMYDNRYILYNAVLSTKQDTFLANPGEYMRTSTEANASAAWLLSFKNGNRPAWGKYDYYPLRSILSF